jgi:hypothetical protein
MRISNAPGKRLVPSSSGGSMPMWLGYIHVQVMCFCEIVTEKGREEK